MKVLVLLVGLYQGMLACGSDSSEKESPTLGVDLPSAPPHVAKYVTFEYALVCGSDRFTQNEVKESQLVFKDIKNIRADTKCILEVSGDPIKFREANKDVTFVKTPTTNSAIFYMSSESAIVNNQISFSLYPLFSLGSTSQTLVKLLVKVTKDEKQPPDLNNMKQWSLVCDQAKTVALKGSPSYNNTDQWSLEFSFVTDDVNATKKDQCKLSAILSTETYEAEGISVSFDNIQPVNVTLKPKVNQSNTGTANGSGAGTSDVKINAKIEPQKNP